ncbi:MAG: LuxR C-terminal-related transcriptional regulator [Hyphomonadaceae bacterium]
MLDKRLLERPVPKALLTEVLESSSLADLQEILPKYDQMQGFLLTNIIAVRLNGAPVEVGLYTRPTDEPEAPYLVCPEDVRWAICMEAMALMQPFDFLTHRFSVIDDDIVSEFRKSVRAFGTDKAIIIPMAIKDTLAFGIVAFRSGHDASDLHSVVHQVCQLVATIFERFPEITKWPDEYVLSPREIEVLQHTAAGCNEAKIAEKLYISVHTVRKHIENCKKKLDASNKAHAVSIGLNAREIL